MLNSREAGSITISDDLSHISKLEERQFLALRATRDPSLLPPPVSEGRPTPAETQRRLLILQHQRQLQSMEEERQNVSESVVVEPVGTMGESANGVQTTLKRRLSDSPSEVGLDDHILGLDIDGLQNYISRLAKRATYLKMTSGSKSQPTHRHLTLYRIQSYTKTFDTRRSRPDPCDLVLSAPFLDAPEWIGSVDTGALNCKVPIQNFDLFLEKNKDIAFIVFKTYAARRTEPDFIASESDNLPEIIVNESIKPITKELVAAVRLLLGSQDEYTDLWHDFKATLELSAPYLFVFHQRGYTDTLRDPAKQASQEQLMLLWNYVIQKHGDEYTAADALLSSGKITSDCIQYLFKPGDIVIQRKTDFCSGWVAKTWAKHVETRRTSRAKARAIISRTSQIPLYGTERASREMVNESVWVQNWTIPAWNWEFDGNFQRKHLELSISIVTEDHPGLAPGTTYASKPRADEAVSSPEEIPINGLEVFPVRYAPAEVVQQLRRRGKAFWECRNRQLVSYEEPAKDSQENIVSKSCEVVIAC